MDWNGRRILVTGAAGFIGSHLVEALIRRGAKVRAFIRYTSAGSMGFLEPNAKEAEVFLGDLGEAASVRQAMEGQEYIFHLGALIGIPYSFLRPEEVVEVNTIGTLNVLTAARQAHPLRVILTSTSEVYGTARYVPIDETHPLQAQSPYAASKIAADKLGESFHLTFGTPVAIVRPFNTFGPRQSARAVIPTICMQALTSGVVKLGATSPTRDFVFVKDTAEGFIRAAEAEGAVGEVVNLATGVEISIENLAQKIAALTGKPIQIETEVQRLRPESGEVMRLCGNNEKARRLLGWIPRFSLEEGLLETLEWFRRSPHLQEAARYRV